MLIVFSAFKYSSGVKADFGCQKQNFQTHLLYIQRVKLGNLSYFQTCKHMKLKMFAMTGRQNLFSDEAKLYHRLSQVPKTILQQIGKTPPTTQINPLLDFSLQIFTLVSLSYWLYNITTVLQYYSVKMSVRLKSKHKRLATDKNLFQI